MHCSSAERITVGQLAHRGTLTTHTVWAMMAPPVQERRKVRKRSFVHDYFETVTSDGDDSVKKLKCKVEVFGKKCTYERTQKHNSTSSMQFHLFNTHGISPPSQGDDKDKASSLLSRVMDPHLFNENPDTDPDPDPALFLTTDPDPDLRIRIQFQIQGFDGRKLEEITAGNFFKFFFWIKN